ncbi:MAG: hypothetical protein GY869_32460 [Planctomycetes bacterium]|nr:hypothetical protein [Planctomycetota bacterium]
MSGLSIILCSSTSSSDDENESGPQEGEWRAAIANSEPPNSDVVWGALIPMHLPYDNIGMVGSWVVDWTVYRLMFIIFPHVILMLAYTTSISVTT